MQDPLIADMDSKLKNKLLREGDRVKTWALANKFKQKKAKR
jgi:CCR4-NOT transcriptional regulation complex NOT5 subunit